MTLDEVKILRLRDRQLVLASLCPMDGDHLDTFERTWKPILLKSSEQDQYWEWRFKYRTYGSRVGSESYIVEYDGQLQGVMLIESLGHRSWLRPTRRLVYVHSLATAPWNRPTIQNPPSYRLVGSALLDFAQYRSQVLGYGSVIGLHSLSGAEDFYRQSGLLEYGADPDKENLIYFESSPQDISLEETIYDRVDWGTQDSDDGVAKR
jgi:hypothetical protein